MSKWWIAFWLVEAALIGVVVVPKFFRHDPTSADVEMGTEIGDMLLVGFAIVIGVIAFWIFAWHHFRFAP